jgi:formylmethanofuran dehydrogenase subunit B
MSRYTTFATGFFVPEARHGRTIIVADTRKTETAGIADEFIRIERGRDYEVLSDLRAIVRGKESIIPREVAGVSREQLIRVAGICKKAKFGAIFFGLGLTMSAGKYKNVRNAIELTDELNRHTKFTISPLRGHSNVYGSNEVFTWITGYPYAVDFSRGIMFYNPGETTAVDILRRGECDAALVVASDPGAHFPHEAAAHLAKIPTVLIDPHRTATTPLSRLQIPCTIAGIDAEGTAYRMDGVPIRYRKILASSYPDDADLLQRIHDRIQEVQGA